MTENKYSTDVVIIGAGPTGLFSVFELGMLKIKCHVIDSLEEIGGQCRALYPEKPIYDIPAYKAITANDLIDNLEAQAAPFEPTYHLNQTATELNKTEAGYIVKTSKGNEIECKAIIIAAGAGAFGPNRPPLENLSEYEGKSAFYMVKNKEDFRGKNIVIAGGGDSAFDWAISLAEIAKKIYFIHRRDSFRAAPDSVRILREISATGKIELLTPYQLNRLIGNEGMLTQVEIKDMEDNIKMLDADILLPLFGIMPNLGSIKSWGLELDGPYISVDKSTMLTNLPAVFAVGDIAQYPNKLRLMLAGFSEAATAAHMCYSKVYPNEALHFVHSTSKGVGA